MEDDFSLRWFGIPDKVVVENWKRLEAAMDVRCSRNEYEEYLFQKRLAELKLWAGAPIELEFR